MKRLAKAGETELVEFKGTGTSVPDIVELVVCFANGEGGLILWGIADDGAIAGVKWADLDALRSEIYRSTSPSQVVTVQALIVAVTRVIAVWVEPSSRLVSTAAARYTQRVGRECLPMTPDRVVIRQIDTRTLDVTDAITPVPPERLDRAEIDRYRRALPEESGIRGHSDDDLLLALQALQMVDGRPQVTLAGLLVFGRTEDLRELVPHHEIAYVRTPRGDTEIDRRVLSTAPLLTLIDEVQRDVQAASSTRTMRVGPRHIEVPDYPQDALRESLVNALAHRHYTLPGQVVIRQTSSWVEIENPGGFPEGISPETVIHHAPVHRNRRLCEILERVRYMERSGLGVDRIYVDQLRFGKAPPIYTAERTFVRLHLGASDVDEPFARLVLAEEEALGRAWTVETLLLMSHLRRMGPADRSTLARVMQQSDEEAHEVIGTAIDARLVERFGSGAAIRFGLSARVQAALGAEATYTRERGLAREYQRGIVLQHARKFGRIDNRSVRGLLGVSVGDATQVLKRLGARGDLVQVGSRRWAYWEPASEPIERST